MPDECMQINSNKIVYPELSYKIVGVLFKVHNKLGPRYQEKYYQRAIETELDSQKIKYIKQIPIDLEYDNKIIGRYFLDFLIDGKIALEIKAVSRLRREDFRQISQYLQTSGLKLGILANFRTERLSYKRILNSKASFA
jgi:GxxExxY protein